MPNYMNGDPIALYDQARGKDLAGKVIQGVVAAFTNGESHNVTLMVPAVLDFHSYDAQGKPAGTAKVITLGSVCLDAKSLEKVR